MGLLAISAKFSTQRSLPFMTSGTGLVASEVLWNRILTETFSYFYQSSDFEVKHMFKTPPSQQRCLNWFRLIDGLTPLTLGVALLTSVAMPVEARPVVIQSAPSTSYIYGSPIPSPVPVNPFTGQPSSIYGNPQPTSVRVYPATGQPYSVSPYGYPDYNSGIRRGRGVIRDSTLVNPTVINSTISDSVLVDPVIIDSSRLPYGRQRRSGIIYNSPGLGIRIGY